MAEINFYHMTRSTLEQILPELLEKTLTRGWKAVVIAGSIERVESLTQYLWTYRSDSFLPHGNTKDGSAETQPIWLTHLDERPNAAEILFLVDGAQSTKQESYRRVCEIFSGQDDAAVAAARGKWQDYQVAGHSLSYWQQSDTGWKKQL